MSTILFLVFTISTDIYAKVSNYSNDKNQTKIDNSFLIKYSSRGGYGGTYNSIFYNSTNNHLLLRQQSYDTVLPEITLSESLSDTQLNDMQQKTLRKMIEDSNFFYISYKNNEPHCCDITYYYLGIILGHKVNWVSWTSTNYENSSQYKRIPLEVTNIVETLEKYTQNSTQIYSQSEIKK